MKNNGWLGFLAGLAVGAGVYAFLSSPEGKAWLNRMKQKAKDWGEEWEGMAGAFDAEELAKEEEASRTN